MELVDMRDLKSLEHCARAGSSPALGTKRDKSCFFTFVPFFFSSNFIDILGVQRNSSFTRGVR